jgi:hypothetical protein
VEELRAVLAMQRLSLDSSRDYNVAITQLALAQSLARLGGPARGGKLHEEARALARSAEAELRREKRIFEADRAGTWLAAQP